MCRTPPGVVKDLTDQRSDVCVRMCVNPAEQGHGSALSRPSCQKANQFVSKHTLQGLLCVKRIILL